MSQPKPVGKWVFAKKLGTGGSGTVVWLAQCEEGGEQREAAVKQFDKQPELEKDKKNVESGLQDMQTEVANMRGLQHDHVVELLDVVEDERVINIVMEFCPRGSLKHLLERNGKMNEEEARGYITQVLRALDYIHNQGLVHRDIKGDNIFVAADGSAKVGDFGISKRLKKDELTNTVVGTPYYMAPEVIEWDQSYNQFCDCWSVGALAIELLTGEPPHFGLAPMVASYRIVGSDHMPLPPGLSMLCNDFLTQCFRRDPELRGTAADLLRHPWLSSADSLAVPVVDATVVPTRKAHTRRRSIIFFRKKKSMPKSHTGGNILGVLTLGKRRERYNSKAFRLVTRSVETHSHSQFSSRVFVFRLFRLEFHLSESDWKKGKPPRGYVEYSWVVSMERKGCDLNIVFLKHGLASQKKVYDLRAKDEHTAIKAHAYIAGGMALVQGSDHGYVARVDPEAHARGRHSQQPSAEMLSDSSPLSDASPSHSTQPPSSPEPSSSHRRQRSNSTAPLPAALSKSDGHVKMAMLSRECTELEHMSSSLESKLHRYVNIILESRAIAEAGTEGNPAFSAQVANSSKKLITAGIRCYQHSSNESGLSSQRTCLVGALISCFGVHTAECDAELQDFMVSLKKSRQGLMKVSMKALGELYRHLVEDGDEEEALRQVQCISQRLATHALPAAAPEVAVEGGAAAQHLSQALRFLSGLKAALRQAFHDYPYCLEFSEPIISPFLVYTSPKQRMTLLKHLQALKKEHWSEEDSEYTTELLEKLRILLERSPG